MHSGGSNLRLLGLGLTFFQVFSFDLGDHQYVQPVVELYQALLPGRFHFFKGDSTRTIPEFHKSVGDGWAKCDLFCVDGGHFGEIPLLDLRNVAPLMKPGGILVVDDTTCKQKQCSAPTAAVYQVLDEGLYHDLFCSGQFKKRGICTAVRS